MSILHRVEHHGKIPPPDGKFVDLSFETESKGYWQCRVTSERIKQFADEPPLNTLPVDEQNQIYEIALITYYFTHGEHPEHLSSFDT
jgi:hypothetical protein